MSTTPIFVDGQVLTAEELNDGFESTLKRVGAWDASDDTFPPVDAGSGPDGQILAGNLWTISVAGTPGGVSLSPKDSIYALIDDPGQTLANWGLISAPDSVAYEQTFDEFIQLPNLTELTYPLSKNIQPGTVPLLFLGGSLMQKSVGVITGNPNDGYEVTVNLDPAVANITYYNCLQIIYPGA